MNKFITTYLGGLPAYLNDLRFLDDAYRLAFKGVMSTYGVADNEVVILSGCVEGTSGSNSTLTPGYVSIGGEICYVPEQIWPTPSHISGLIAYFDFNLSYDSEGLKVFENSTVNDTYQIRTVKISLNTVVPSGYTPLAAAKTVYQLISENFGIQQISDAITALSPFIVDNSFHYIGNGTNGLGTVFANGFGGLGGSPSPHQVAFRKVNNMVEFTGACKSASPGVGVIHIFTLPEGYRPVSRVYLSVNNIDIINNPKSSYITIGTDGEVKVYNYAYSSTEFVSEGVMFEGLRFSII